MSEEFLPVRLSHLLRHCSVGAIVRWDDSLVVVPDIRQWHRHGQDVRDREIRYVDQVRSALGISQVLCKPPVKLEQDGNVLGGIPALRFPSWMHCRKCGLLHYLPWRRDDSAKMEDLRCAEKTPDCDGRLEQSPWVLVHERGYLADAPWHDLAHRDARNPEQRQCRADWENPPFTASRGRSRSPNSLHPMRFVRKPGVAVVLWQPHLAAALDPGAARRATGRTRLAAGDQRCPACTPPTTGRRSSSPRSPGFSAALWWTGSMATPEINEPCGTPDPCWRASPLSNGSPPTTTATPAMSRTPWQRSTGGTPSTIKPSPGRI